MEVTDELIERIANYLGKQPYFEVVVLISDLQKAAKGSHKPPDKES